MKGHQAMMRFENRRQRDDESIDRFLDDLESLRRRSDPEESTNRRNFSDASKFIDGVKSDDLRTMLATYYTLSKDNAPTSEEMRQKTREYMLMKPKKYSYPENRNMQGGSQQQRSSWYKLRDDMDKRRSCANCGSADHPVADCTTYKQGMKSLGYAPDEEDMSQTEEHEFYNSLIIKIGARCFFCNQEGHFRMDCPLFWETVKNQSHPKHKLALAAVQNTRNRQAEFDTKNSEARARNYRKNGGGCSASQECHRAETRNSVKIKYEKAAAEAINKVKQDLATKEIEQRIKQEIERQKLNETICRSVPMSEAEVGATKSGNCNTLKMVIGKPFGITKIGARIMSIITVGGHEVTRKLSEPSDQTTMHIDVYADYLSAISPEPTSRALRALLIRGGSKSVSVENRYTSDKVEATDKEREKNIKKDMQEMKQRYDTVNSKLGSLETRMDTMSRDQAESSCSIQAKLDAILRNSTSQDKPVKDRTQGNRVDFVEPQQNKWESTPLPLPRGAASIGPGGPRQL